MKSHDQYKLVIGEIKEVDIINEPQNEKNRHNR